ncbi:MAG: TerC family protein [Planctomycetes bacterium]|nr:TerC family protein [Planctomycetota bacterium]
MTFLIWMAFLLLVSSLVALDLGVFHRRAHVVRIREALGWTAVWVTVALMFNVGVYFLYENGLMGAGKEHPAGAGKAAAIEFFTGYLVEESLSVDNIFVIAVIFAYFRIPIALQHRVLFWGILGAVVLRVTMILLGTALIARFEWIMYVFGVMLLYSAYKMLSLGDEPIDPEKNILTRITRRFIPVTTRIESERFFVRDERGALSATPLFLALLVVESSDVMFAVDSIPAVFAVTQDPFIVFTSNVFAIMGLRSLYFAVAGMMNLFHYLKTSLVVLLAFIGVKMLLTHHVEIPNPVSLAIIATILAIGVGASLIVRNPRADPDADGDPPRADRTEEAEAPVQTTT